MSFLDSLNPQQREAVETTEGPVLILAGAGSGKTRVITYRIAHLIEDLGVQPESILAVTFTNKAAAEMAERVEKMCGGRMFGKPVISTFHSFCVRVLRRDVEKLQINGKGLRKDFVIYDEADQQMVVKAAMRRLGLNDKETKPSAILSKISWAKNHMMDPQDLYLNSGDPKTEKIAHIYNIYRQELAKSNAMDFDDLLLEAVRLLKSVTEVREYYNRRFRYILVDEYQDTNRPQYEMMRMLAGERRNLCVVGDEDQSIYSWRGADIRNILEYEQDFPNAKIIRLEENYRSTQNILTAAGAVVSNNVKRKGKNLFTSRQGGAMIGFYEAPDGENEALFTADYISKYVRQQLEDGNDAKIAILYRVNSTSRLFEEALRRYSLKYHVVGGFSFYERSEIKDMISYLKVVHNPDDSIALQRVINTPARGLGKQTMESVERMALETGMSLWNAIGEAIERRLLPMRAVNGLKAFREIVCDARAMLLGKFEEQMGATAAVDAIAASEEDTPKPAAIEVPDENIAFDFGMNEGVAPGSSPAGPDFVSDDVSFLFGTSADDNARATAGETPALQPKVDLSEISFSFGNLGGTTSPNAPKKYREIELPPRETQERGTRVFTISKSRYDEIRRAVARLRKTAEKRGIPVPEIEVHAEGPQGEDDNPIYYRISAKGEMPRLKGWRFAGAIRHEKGENELHPLPGQEFPAAYVLADAKCDACQKKQNRHYTFIIEHENGGLKQVGSDCVNKFLDVDASHHIWFSEKLFQIQDQLEHYSKEPIKVEEPRRREEVPVERYEISYPVRSPRDLVRGSGSAGQEPPTSFEERVFLPEIKEEEEPASVAEILKFLIDRTGYVKMLEVEDTPEAQARIENLHELVNAAMDSRDRGETLGEFLDHAALVSDADQYDEKAQITLMTLHAAKGLEFPLVFLVGLEEGLFPHSRTFNDPDGIEEERRLCYVGMTRAMDTLVITRARYRRRWGTDSPEASVPSRFLEEVPPQLIEDLGSPRTPSMGIGTAYRDAYGAGSTSGYGDEHGSRHYDYENEDQSGSWGGRGKTGQSPVPAQGFGGQRFGGRGQDVNGQTPRRRNGRGSIPIRSGAQSGPAYNSIDNIAEFFASRGKKFTLNKDTLKASVPEPTGNTGFRPGQKVRHPKYGEGTVYQREGEGDSAKLTVQFPRFGIKKLVEKYAQLEKA